MCRSASGKSADAVKPTNCYFATALRAESSPDLQARFYFVCLPKNANTSGIAPAMIEP